LNLLLFILAKVDYLSSVGDIFIINYSIESRCNLSIVRI
jgi:hypothetical protein